MRVTKNDNISIIEVSGIDRVEFLNNILTNDVLKVSNKNSIYTCLLSPQGKLIADLILSDYKDSLFICSYSKFKDDLIKVLSMYKLRSKVKIEDVSDDYQYYFVDYENLQSRLNKSEIFSGNSFLLNNSLLVIDPRLAELGAHVITTDNLIDGKKYEINNCDINLNYFKHGIVPSSILSNMKKVYPLEANIHLLNGIDFKKGCYVGQEVTARMKLKNKIPKIIFSLISDRLIEDEHENEDIYANDQVIGKIIAKYEKFYFVLIDMRKVQGEDLKTMNLCSDNSNFVLNHQSWFGY
jgi:folate-binding protein YgfZ